MEPPKVTFALITYNQEKYVKEAIESALSQNYPELEIIISDDASSDCTYQIIQEETGKYRGPHKLIVRRNSENIGLAEHVNLINRIATGTLIVVAAGDDLSKFNRVQRIVDIWLRAGRPHACIWSAAAYIDEYTKATGKYFRSHYNWEKVTPKEMITKNPGVLGASQAWTKSLNSMFRPIIKGVINEDIVIPFRAALVGRILYIDEDLVKYRTSVGLGSIYGNKFWPNSRTPSILFRPYIAAVQRSSDLNQLNMRNTFEFQLIRNRRAEHLYRYWLSKRKSLSRKKILYFTTRCRLTWIARESYFAIKLRILTSPFYKYFALHFNSSSKRQS